MPNYTLNADFHFNPHSLEDYLAPALADTQAHLDIQDKLAELNEQANIWEGMINPENEPIANAMYQKYVNDLRVQADQLQRSGLTYSSRQNMLNIKARYNSEIKPIETAFNRRRELVNAQLAGKEKDATKLYEYDASKMSLDDFIRNPETTYGWEGSGAQLMSMSSAAAANLAKEMRTPEGYAKLEKLGIPYVFQLINRYGFASQEVHDAMMQYPGAQKVLTDLAEEVMQASSVYSTNNPDLIEEARRYVNLGLYSAIGEAKPQVLTDKFNMKDALNARQYERTHPSKTDDDDLSGLISPDVFDLGAPSEVDKNILRNNKHLNDIGNILGFDKESNSFSATSALSTKSPGIGHKEGYVPNNIKTLAIKGGLQPTYNDIPLFNSQGKGDFAWFNEDGTLKTKEQFVAQAGHSHRSWALKNEAVAEHQTKQSQLMLGYIYDGMIKTLHELDPDFDIKTTETRNVVNLRTVDPNNLTTNPLDPNQTPISPRGNGMIETIPGFTPLYSKQTISSILSGRYIDDTGKNGKVLEQKAALLDYGENNNKYFKNTFAPKLGKNEENISKLHPLIGWNADGSPVYSHKQVKTSTFFNDEGNAKGSISYYVPLGENSECIVVVHDSGQYVVKLDDLGTKVQAAKQAQRDLVYCENRKQEIINAHGGGDEGLYWYEHSKQGKQNEKDIAESFDTIATAISDAIGGSLKVSTTTTRRAQDRNISYSQGSTDEDDDSYVDAIYSRE